MLNRFSRLPIDGATALGDGLMIVRRLFSGAFLSDALTQDVLSSESPYFGESDAWKSVDTNIQALMPRD